MIITTREKPITLAWVCEEMALVMLDEHDDNEMLRVRNVGGHILFECSFGALKKLRDIKACSERVNNNYSERRRLVEEMQLAAGGGPS